jgi:hypothetical protein
MIKESASSEDYSNRVAERTHLILIQDEFGASQGMLDLEANEHEEHTRV